MKVNRGYELIVRRASRGPALLADPARPDTVEVVEVDSGEVVLFWDTLPSLTGRLVRALRTDLAQLDSEVFLNRWQRYEQRR